MSNLKLFDITGTLTSDGMEYVVDELDVTSYDREKQRVEIKKELPGGSVAIQTYLGEGWIDNYLIGRINSREPKVNIKTFNGNYDKNLDEMKEIIRQHYLAEKAKAEAVLKALE